MQRGEVWWANLVGPAGRRTVILLSRDRTYLTRAQVTVAPVTRTIRNIASEVRLGPEDGLPAECVINLDDILTIHKFRLTDRISTLSKDKMNAVTRAVVFALDLRFRY